MTLLLLPVYNAHEFQRILRKGGRTQPWLVLVNVGDKLIPYVVKMFTTELIDEMDSVTNEVLGNVLAREFDLPVPDAALIVMDEDFLKTIDDPEALSVLELKDSRIKFGTRLIPSAIEYQRGVFSISEIKNFTDIDTVFAFDYLIRNRDRTIGKPNFLISSRTGFLIDHELGFSISDATAIDAILNPLKDGGYSYHIFYEYLHHSWSKNKEQFFDVFMEYLRFMNINVLDGYFDQLVGYGYSPKKHQAIKDYLGSMKSNWFNFANIMKGIIS